MKQKPVAQDERVAHYRLKERLGAGAMGEVWLAEDTRLHRLVALKRLTAAAAGDSEASARLVREARVASTLSHPNVAVVYDVGEDDQAGQRSAWVAMEYVKGRTLAERLRDGQVGRRHDPENRWSRWPRRWRTRTSTASSTATSSPATSCSASGVS